MQDDKNTAPETASEAKESSPSYEKPKVLEVFHLEALALACTDTNAKMETALGCNELALFS